MSEKDEAIILANKVLDRPNADPDDDLAILARQLLRALERLGEYEPPHDAAWEKRRGDTLGRLFWRFRVLA